MIHARFFTAALMLFFAFTTLGCEKKPIVVTASSAGTEILPLPGKRKIEGTINKKLEIQGREVPVGTRVKVRETWVLRKYPKQGKTGYRITGYYDVDTQTEGLALPRGAADVYFLCEIEGFESNQPIPTKAFEPDAFL